MLKKLRTNFHMSERNHVPIHDKYILKNILLTVHSLEPQSDGSEPCTACPQPLVYQTTLEYNHKYKNRYKYRYEYKYKYWYKNKYTDGLEPCTVFLQTLVYQTTTAYNHRY